MPSVVFLNFGAEPQSAVGSIKELRTDYSKMKKKLDKTIFKVDETDGDFSKRVENTVEKLLRKTKSSFPTVFLNICTVET